MVMRDPSDPGWPRDGARTEFGDVAREWRWAYLRTLQGKRWRRQAGVPEPKPDLAAAVRAYLAHRTNTVATSTWETDRSALRKLRAWAGAGRLDDVDLQGWAESMLADGYRASTVRLYTTVGAAMMRYHDAEPPAVTVPDPGTTGVRAWSDAELVALRQAADRAGLRARLERAIGTGARRNELVALRWEDFNRFTGSALIARQVNAVGKGMRPTKSRQLRTSIVLPTYWEWHDDGRTGLIEDPPPSPSTMHREFRDLLEDAGLAHVGDAGWHTCRHTFARLYLEDWGGDLMELASFLGHSKVETTRTFYGHFSQSAAVRIGRRRVYGEG